jgi:hypothetical protein
MPPVSNISATEVPVYTYTNAFACFSYNGAYAATFYSTSGTQDPELVKQGPDYENRLTIAIGKQGFNSNIASATFPTCGTSLEQAMRFLVSAQTNSQVATPTASVTPGSDAQANNVVLLMHMDGNHGSNVFTDSGRNSKNVTRIGSPQISTTQSKFGGSSAYFDGSSAISFSPSQDWSFGSGDFTIECWVYLLSHGYPEPSTTGYNHFFSVTNQNTFGFKSWRDAYYLYTGTLDVMTTTGPVLNSWQHLALSRNGTSLKIFVNGVQTGSSTISSTKTFGANDTVFIGSGWEGEFLHGYIDEFRVTKGVGRYNTNFTPPTSAFTNP